MLIIFLPKKKKKTQSFSQRVLGASDRLIQGLKMADKATSSIFNYDNKRQHADSNDPNKNNNRTAEHFPFDRLVNTYLHALLLNPSPHLPMQVPGVCLWSHTDLQLFCSLTHPPATWQGLQLRWQWGSDPSTPERLGRRASASFRCRETPQVSKPELSGLWWCGYKS